MSVIISNVRLAFPVLFDPKSVNGGAERFSATFLFAPDHEAVLAVKKEMMAVAKGKWGEKAASVLKTLAAQNRLALHDGAEKENYAGYAGNMFINASNDERPHLVNRRNVPVTAADGVFYSGCYVNAEVGFWAQDNQFGKRINANLMGVQFFADGERLAASGGVSGKDTFKALEESPADDVEAEEISDDDIPF